MGLLKIYRENRRKNYQLNGNFQNYQFDLIQVDNEFFNNFRTGFLLTGDTAVSLTSFKIYSIDTNKIKNAKTLDDLDNIRTLYATVDLGNLSQRRTQIGDDKYYEIYLTNKYLDTYLPYGVYELEIITNVETLRSELFSPCMINDYKNAVFASEFECSNAAISNVDYGDTPTLTIDVDEIGLWAGSASITVTWNVTKAPLLPVTLPFILGDTSTQVVETQTKTFTAGQQKTYTFEYTDSYLEPGDYSVSYEANFPGCSGELEFTVNSSLSIDQGGSGWDTAGATGPDYLQVIDFDLTVDNANASARECTVTFNIGSLPVTFTATIAGLGSHVFSKTYTLNRYSQHTMSVSGSVTYQYVLPALPAP